MGAGIGPPGTGWRTRSGRCSPLKSKQPGNWTVKSSIGNTGGYGSTADHRTGTPDPAAHRDRRRSGRGREGGGRGEPGRGGAPRRWGGGGEGGGGGEPGRGRRPRRGFAQPAVSLL